MKKKGLFCKVLDFLKLGNLSCSLEPVIDKKDEFTDDMIHNIRKFSEMDVENILIPRSEIKCVSIDSTKEELIKCFQKYLHTRILVYSENKDNIVGFVHIKDLFEKQNSDVTIASLMRKVMYVTDNITLIHILRNMQKTRTYISVVLDEHSGVRGMITIGDVIDELIPMKDEHTNIHDKDMCYVVDDKNLILDGRVRLHDLEDILNIRLTEEDVDTIGGLLLFEDKITKPLVIENVCEFKIGKFDGRVVKSVKMILLNKDIKALDIKMKIDG